MEANSEKHGGTYLRVRDTREGEYDDKREVKIEKKGGIWRCAGLV